MRLGWLIVAGSGAFLAGAAPAAITEYSPVPAQAGNQAELCIRWSVTQVADGDDNAGDKVRLIFTFRNQCTRDAHVALYWYYESLEKIAGWEYITVPAMQSFGDQTTTTTHVLYSKKKHLALRYWVLESSTAFGKDNRPNMSRCNKKFNAKRNKTACPKYFTF